MQERALACIARWTGGEPDEDVRAELLAYAEVVAATDPNNAGSHPEIPSLPPPGAVALVLALLATAVRPLRALRGEAR